MLKNILMEAYSWGSSDIDKLEYYYSELDEIRNEVKRLGSSLYYGIDEENTTDINSIFYIILNITHIYIVELIKLHYPALSDKVNSIEPNIYINYLDSRFDSHFGEFDIDLYNSSISEREYLKVWLLGFEEIDEDDFK